MKPILLDLFCGAGGAAKGYWRAGFEVVGIDNRPQPHYPYQFIEADAISWSSVNFDLVRAYFSVIHASPPCQFGTAYKRRPGHVHDSPNLIPATRNLLVALGLPYVIENNYTNRSHLIDPIVLCGSSFGRDVQRHRCFESSVPLAGLGCDHAWQTPRFPAATNRKNLRRTVEVGVWRISLIQQRLAMGIDWMDLEELSEAVPPDYTEWIGRQLFAKWEGGELESAQSGTAA